jgi:hypothetical protein
VKVLCRVDQSRRDAMTALNKIASLGLVVRIITAAGLMETFVSTNEHSFSFLRNSLESAILGVRLQHGSRLEDSTGSEQCVAVGLAFFQST